MKSVRWLPAGGVFFGLLFFLASAAGAADKYVKIVQDKVEIMTAPQAAATVVCSGRKGDLFRLVGPAGDWYQVEMFSGEGRYLRKSAAQVTTARIAAPRDFSKRKAIFTALFEAEGQAQKEAAKPDKWGTYFVDPVLFRVLSDRYKLAVMRRFAVQPPIYGQIRKESPKF